MNSFTITIKSAAHTARAIAKKGYRDVQITWEFITDEEMIELYRAVYQSMRGLAFLMYGLGVLSRRAMDRLIEESLGEPSESLQEASQEASESMEAQESTEPSESTTQESTEPSESIPLATIATDWETDLIPYLMEEFKALCNHDKRLILKERGLPYRARNRRFNGNELCQIYENYLKSL